MIDPVNEWVEKAEGDYVSARRECRARKSPNYDAAAFHAQQCIEKYLKALLQFHGVRIPKTHDLLALLERCDPFAPELELQKDAISILNQYAVAYRYPGASVNRDQAKQAVKTTGELRPILRNCLLLTDD